MPTLYVTEQGASLHKEGDRIVVRKDRRELAFVQTFKLEQVVLFGNVGITPVTIAHFLREGIDTVFLDTQGRYRGRLTGPEAKNILLRRIQFQKYEDEAFRLTAVRSIVRGKIQNMRTLIMRMSRHRGIDVSETVHRMRLLCDETETTTTVDALRGLEGAASAAYFGVYRHFLAEGFQFEKRERRPPKDPANAMLSFGYTLLGNSIEGSVHLVGLDPYLGFLHVVDYGRPSLVLDLMEEFRPVIIDSLVADLVNHGVLSPATDFEQRDEGVYLAGEGRRTFIKKYQERIAVEVAYPVSEGNVQKIPYSRCFEMQARKFVRFLKGETPVYTPYLIR